MALRRKKKDEQTADIIRSLQIQIATAQNKTEEVGAFWNTATSTPVSIAAPSGWAVVDAEARAAIVAVINRLNALGLS